MTWPNPPQLPNPPREPITVPVKPCCGVLTSDVCDCADLWAETVAAFRSPIRWQAIPDSAEVRR